MPGGSDEFNATEITSFPYQDDNLPTSWFQVFWYKYTPTLNGVHGFRAALSTGSLFDPQLTVYHGTPGSLELYFFNGYLAEDGRPITVPTFRDDTIYLKVEGASNLGTPAATVTLYGYVGPHNGSYGRGAILIPDDTSAEYPTPGVYTAFPGAVLDASTGEVLRLQMGINSCEAGATIPSGSFLLDSNISADFLYIFNASLRQQFAVAPPVSYDAGTGTHRLCRYDDTSWLIASDSGSNANLWTVDEDGEYGLTTWTISGNVLSPAVDPDAEILYYASTGVAGAAVKRYDLNASGTLSDLVAGIAGYLIVRDAIIVLADGTICVGYQRITPRDNLVKHYSAAGATLHTYSLGGGLYDLDRICRTLEDPDTLLAWVHEFVTPNETSRFITIEIATGTQTEVPAPIYQSNVGIGPSLVSPPQFGHSFSCPILILPDGSCVCQPRPAYGGGRGFSGGDRSEGEDPFRELVSMALLAQCSYGGDVPDGTNGTDTEDWAD